MAKLTFGEKYYIHSTVVTVVLFFFYVLGVNTSFLYTSLLDYKSILSDAFDGTVYPIEFVPNPMQLSYEQRKQPFDTINSKFFIKTPLYNPDIFGKDIDSLPPGSKDYADAITQRVIFTVPYVGTYNFDYKEYSGSHPGVDIIAPTGTPVRNIAAGVVVDVGYQGGGFGNYVLVKHNGVPLPNGTKGNIYSLYAHMSKAIAETGMKIKKGTVVGYVGQSGTATTPHLHFQIDVDNAPFSPYWPFTTLDMKTAGVGFFDGVNIGLGKENVIRYTISPLKFVNDNLNLHENNSNILVSNDDEKSQPKEEAKTPENSNVDVPKNNQEEKSTQEVKAPQKDDEKKTDNEDLALNTQIVVDSNSNIVKKEELVNKDVVLLSSINPETVLKNNTDLVLADNSDLISLTQDDLNHSLQQVDDTVTSDIENNDTQVTIPTATGKTLQEVLPEETLTGETQTTSTGIVLSGATLSGTLFKDIGDDYKYFQELSYFKDKNIVSGFKDNTFRPENNITRIESLKMILLSFGIDTIKNEKAKFVDINTTSWENTYVNAAVKANIISLDNQKFFPERNVSRVEALKIIFTLAGVDMNTLDTDVEYADVKKTDWYYKYVVYAVKNNLIQIKDNNFLPNKPLSREELISVLYKLIQK